VHLKDKRGGKGVADFPPLGDGDIDIPRILQTLADAGFDGPVSMEIEFTDYSWPPFEQCISEARRSKAYWDGLGF
jgi:sugar phosphate isomerase/epimerase